MAINLHSTMVRLTILDRYKDAEMRADLHSTMVRLTILIVYSNIKEDKGFTFHYG